MGKLSAGFVEPFSYKGEPARGSCRDAGSRAGTTITLVFSHPLRNNHYARAGRSTDIRRRGIECSADACLCGLLRGLAWILPLRPIIQSSHRMTGRYGRSMWPRGRHLTMIYPKPDAVVSLACLFFQDVRYTIERY